MHAEATYPDERVVVRRMYLLLGLTLLGVVIAYFAVLSGFVERTRGELEFALRYQQMRAALDGLDRLALMSHLDAVRGTASTGPSQDLIGELVLQGRLARDERRARVRALTARLELAESDRLVERLERQLVAFEGAPHSTQALERVLLVTEQIRHLGARALELREEERSTSLLGDRRWVTALLLALLASTVWAGALVVRSGRATLRGLGQAIRQRDEQSRALESQRDFAASLLDTAPVIVLLLDSEGRIRHVNRYFEQITGYGLDDVQGRDWFTSFVPERERAGIRALFRSAVQGEPTRGGVNAILTRAGGERQVEWYDQIMRDPDGNATLLAVGQDVTERVRAAAALDELTERLTEAQRIAQLGSWELELATGLLTWSEEVFRIFELDPRRFGASYAAFLDAIHPEDREAVDRAYSESLRTQVPYSITHRLLMADGRVKHVHERCETAYDGEGRPLRSVGTIQDVSELHRAAAARERAETTLRAIFERSAEGMLLVDAEGLRFQASNVAIRRMLGYEEDELRRLAPADIHPPDQRRQIEQQYAAALRGELDRVQAVPMLRRDGGVFFADIAVTPLSLGARPYVLALFRDVSAMREAERALAIKDAAIESSITAIAMVGMDGRITYVNRAFVELWRLDGAERAIGREPAEFVLQGAAILAALQQVGHWQGDANGLRPEGSTIDLYLSAHLVTDDEGRPLCSMGSFVDLTERKRAEEDVRRLNDDLERRVAERTQQLANKNTELETFTYSVSHDLKAPLRGIDGYSRLLLEDYADRLDATGRLFLRNVRTATEQMSDLIDDLLAYSRLERRDVQTELVDAKALVDALLVERAEDVRRQGASVVVKVNCAALQADREGLAMALRNLLDNALKFSRGGAPPVIEIGARDGDGACVLWVRDNGPGFDMRFHDRIFAIFQRLHRAEDYPGTGVGLAIVRKAMDRMHGRAWAESVPGQGATFYLEIAR